MGGGQRALTRCTLDERFAVLFLCCLYIVCHASALSVIESIFSLADKEGEGLIDSADLEKLLEDAPLRASFASIAMGFSEAAGLFRLFDCLT